MNATIFGKKLDCGCENRKTILMADDWKTDLAILAVISLSIAAIYAGLKLGKVIGDEQ